MASSSRPIDEGQKRTNWYRCSRLLIEGSLAILKEFLKDHCKGQLGSFLNTNNGILQKLHSKRILSQDQMNQLFPHADLESLDITLITCILLNCQPKLKPAQDQYLKDIRDLRNVLFAHISSLSLEENEFNYNWGLIRNCLSNAENVFSVNTCLHELVDKVREEEIGNIERFRDELDAWKCSDDKISSALEEFSRKLDEVAENVEEIKARLPERFKGEGDEVNKEVTDEEWSELQNCLMNDYKKFVIKAPISSVSLSYETDIVEIYEEPKLLLVDHTASSKKTFDKNQKPITPKDIFRSDKNKFSNIYVSGDAGMGKTSLCKYILSAWCKAHQKEETGKSDFVLALEQYYFAFYISLRHAIRQDHIEDMIVSQRLQHIVSNNNTKLRGFQPKFLLNEVFRLKSEKCLIILDGLDEWQLSENVQSENDGIPLRDSNLNYTILTTTRPWKLELLRLKESRIDKQVKITGVEDTKMFAEKLILCYNEREKRNETYLNFYHCLLKNDLTELGETPFLLKHLVCVWFYKQNIGKSKTEVYTNMIELWLHNAENRKGVKHLCPSIIDHNIKIPNVFQKRNKCDRYTDLLKAVGKLAYETATQEKVIQLVFDSTDKHGISEDQMRICLDVGILTQSIIPDMTCEQKSISFPHKTFHEFFAALYMGWHCSEHGVITCKTIKYLIEYERENMCIFLSAIWPSEFGNLIGEYYKNKSKDKIDVVCEDNNDDEESRPDKRVRHLLMDCCCESIAVNNYCPKVEFKFISISNNYREDKILFVLSKMYQTDIMRSNNIGDVLDFSSVSFPQKLVIHERQFASLVVSPCLRYLLLSKVHIVTNEGIVDLTSSIATAKNLKRLRICDFNRDRKLKVALDLSNNKNLSILFLKTVHANKLSVSLNITELTLCNFNLASHEKIVSAIKKLSKIIRLERLTLSNVYCSKCNPNKCFLDIDLSETSTLRDICLRKVSFRICGISPTTENLIIQNVHLASHKKLVSTMKKMSKITRLERLTLSDVYCSKHTWNPHKCFLDIDLSETRTLRDIFLKNVSFRICGISPTTENLTIQNVHLASHKKLVSSMKKMSTLTRLKRVKLSYVYCSEHRSHYKKCFLDVDLSETSTLCDICLKNVSFSMLGVSPTTENLTIQDVRLSSHEEIVSTIKKMSNFTRLKKVIFSTVYCSEHGSHEICFLGVDLSETSTLSEITLQQVSFSTLRVSPKTETINVSDINLASYEGHAFLVKHTTTTISRHNISLFIVSCSEQNLPQSSTPGTIKIKKVSLSVGLRETKMSLDTQFASHDAIVPLMKSLSDLTTLKFLAMKNIYCSEHKSHTQCFLDADLSQNTLRHIACKEVSFSKLIVSPTTRQLFFQDIQLASHDDIGSLMKNVTNLTELYHLSLRNAYCSEHKSHLQCFLDVDLSQNSELNIIELKGVSFSKLSVSPTTESLTFHDIQLASHEDIVSLMTNVTNLTQLYHLSLRNVYCSEHKSHSQCFLDVDLSQNSKPTTIKFQGVSFRKLILRPNLADLTFHDIQLASHEDIGPLMKNVTKLTDLFHLSLRNVYCSEHKSHSQCFLGVDLSQNSKLTTIEFQEISFSKLSVSPTTEKLTFNDIQLASHEEVVSLMTNVTNLTELSHLSLRNVYCSEHKSHSQCFLDVDLSQNCTLRTVEVHGVSFSKLIVSPNVANLTFHDIQLASHKDIFSLMKNVTNLTKLYHLSLSNVYCIEHKSHSQCFLDVDLSQNSTLTTIEVHGVSFSKLVVSPNLADLTFHDIQLASHEDIFSLMKNVTNLTQLYHLSLRNLYCSEHKSLSQCFLDVDLSQSDIPTKMLIAFSESKRVFSQTTTEEASRQVTSDNIQFASHEEVVLLREKMEADSSLPLTNVYGREQSESMKLFSCCHFGGDDEEKELDHLYCDFLVSSVFDDMDDKNADKTADEHANDNYHEFFFYGDDGDDANND